jgi:predicted TIM-barrel fold metal-dependent hydrolase
MTDPHFSKQSLKPWVDTCLKAFGPDRCVIGSNWPVDRLYSSYDLIMGFYRDYIAKLSPAEQKKILNKNAAKLYKF